MVKNGRKIIAAGLSLLALLESPKCDKEREDRPGMRKIPIEDEDCERRRVKAVGTWIPDTFMKVSWAFEDRNGSFKGSKVQFGGQFSVERRLCPGGFARIRVEAVDGQILPDELICFVRVEDAQGRMPIASDRRDKPVDDPGRCDAGAVVR